MSHLPGLFTSPAQVQATVGAAVAPLATQASVTAAAGLVNSTPVATLADTSELAVSAGGKVVGHITVSAFAAYLLATTAAVPLPVLTLTMPTGVVSGSSFVIAGTYANDGTSPVLTISVDGGAFQTLPAGSTVTGGVMTLAMGGMSNGTHTVQVKDGNANLSNTVSFAVAPAETLTLDAITSTPAPGAALSLTGGYANGTPGGLDYAITLTGGTVTWTSAVSPTLASGRYSVAVPALPAAGSYTVQVRDHAAQSIVASTALMVAVAAGTTPAPALEAIIAVPVPPATTIAFSPGSVGQLLAILTPVPQGATRSISPNDGRVLLSANSATLVVGMTAASAGSTIPVVVTDTLAGSASATLSVPVTVVTPATAPTPVAIPTLVAFSGAAGVPTGNAVMTAVQGSVAGYGLDGSGNLIMPTHQNDTGVFAGLGTTKDGLYTVSFAAATPDVRVFLVLRSSGGVGTSSWVAAGWAGDHWLIFLGSGGAYVRILVQDTAGDHAAPVKSIGVSLSGSTIILYGDGAQVLTYTATDFPQADGQFGLMTGANTSAPPLIALVTYATPAQAAAAIAAQAAAARAAAAAAAQAKAIAGSPVANPGADGYAAGVYGPDVVFVSSGSSSSDIKFGKYFARGLAGAQAATMTGAPAGFYLGGPNGLEVGFNGTVPTVGDHPATISVTDGVTTLPAKSIIIRCQANCVHVSGNFVLDTMYGAAGYPLGDAHSFQVTNMLRADLAGGALTLVDPAGLLQLAGDPQVYTTDAAYPLASHYGPHGATLKTVGQADQAAQFWFAQEQPAGVTFTPGPAPIYDYFLPGDVLFTISATSDAGVVSYKVMSSSDPITAGLNGAVTATGLLTAGTNKTCTIRTVSGSGVTTDTTHSYTVLAGTVLAPSSITMAVAQNLDNQVLYQVVGTPAVTGMGAGLKWRIVQKEAHQAIFSSTFLQQFTCDPATGKVASAYMLPARTQGHTFTLIASDGPNVCRQTFSVPCTWWNGPTVYVGAGMAALHGAGVGYDHFSDLLPRLSNNNNWPDRTQGVATIIWAANSDPNYYANDCSNGRGAFAADSYTRFGILGSVRIIAADLNGPRVRIGGQIGAPNGGGDIGGKGFINKAAGDLYIEGFEVSWCLGDDAYHGISGVRVNADTYGDCTIIDCDFHDNDNGAELAAEVGIVTIDRSRATNCGANYVSSGATHGFYLEGIEVRVTRTHSYKHTNGHSLKIRSPNFTVTDCVFGDGARGTSSQMLNLPEGGTGYVARNDFHKGPNAQNPACVGYYEDDAVGEWGHISTLTLEDNRFNVLQVGGSRGGTGNAVFHFPRLSTIDGSQSQVLLNRNSFYLYGAAIKDSVVTDSGTDPSPIPMVDTNSILLTQPFPMNFTDPRIGTGQTPGTRPGFFPFTYDNETNYQNMYGVQQDCGTEEIRVPASSPAGTVLATITASGCVIYKLQNVANDIRVNPFVAGTTWSIIQTSEYFPGQVWPPVGAFTLNPSSDGTSVQLLLGTGNVAGTQILKLEATAPNGTKSDWRYPVTLAA